MPLLITGTASVTDGEAGGELMMLGDAPHEIAAGEFYLFASNQPHSYRNDGPVVARFVRNVVI
ncbi:cupin domain-containing protein [Pseudomonas sp. TH39(2020)]|uniref:cupin domain-containing protein n=1 Tax=Pseudomonas sp. TH39(2020) TaxID=2796349 RepID=UPI00313AFC8E